MAVAVPLFSADEVSAVRRAGLRVYCLTPGGQRARVYRAEPWWSDRLERQYERQRVAPGITPGLWMRVQCYYPNGALRWCVPQRVWSEP